MSPLRHFIHKLSINGIDATEEEKKFMRYLWENTYYTVELEREPLQFMHIIFIMGLNGKNKFDNLPKEADYISSQEWLDITYIAAHLVNLYAEWKQTGKYPEIHKPEKQSKPAIIIPDLEP